MTSDPPLRSSYRSNLDQLRATVLRMGSFCVEMLTRAMEALTAQDLELARQVHSSDDVADDLDFEIEKESLRMLASQQPVAGDLRAIVGALRVATDLERIADYAKDIAKVALAVGPAPWFRPMDDTRLMGETAIEILRQSLRAFADQDLELARAIAQRDEELDQLWKKLRDELTGCLQDQPGCAAQAVPLILVARYLERIGDHTVNILERLNYIETGRMEALI